MKAFVLLSLCAGAGWALTNIVDDFVLRTWDRSVVTLCVYAGLSRLGLVPLFVGVGAYTTPNAMAVAGSLLLGGLFFAGMYLYYRALESGEIVGLAVFSESGPLFVLCATVALGTAVTVLDAAGIVLIVTAASLVSVERGAVRKFGIREETGWLLLATLSFSSVSVLADAIASSFQSDFSQLAWMWLGTVGCTVAYVLVSHRANLSQIVDDKAVVGLFGVALVPESLAYIAFFEALELGNVAVASGLSSVKPFVVLGVSLLIPGTEIRTVTTKRVLVLVVAMVLVSVGGYLTQL